MHTTEIVVGKMQSDSSPKMRELLAVGVGQARETAHCHAHSEVLPLHERRADMFRIGIAKSNLGYNLRDWAWGVPPFRAVELPVIKQLHKLREVHIQTKAHRHHCRVVVQSVRRQLNGSGQSLVQVPKKSVRTLSCALANKERRNEFGFFVNGYKHPLISDLRIFAAACASAFLLNEGPDFVNLQIPGLESAHLVVHQFRAALASHQQQAHDGIPIQSSEPLSTADRAAFQQTMQGADRSMRARLKRVPRLLFVGFRESVFAGSAFPALDMAFTEGTSLHAG